jgi:hypothetical protein
MVLPKPASPMKQHLGSVVDKPQIGSDDVVVYLYTSASDPGSSWVPAMTVAVTRQSPAAAALDAVFDHPHLVPASVADEGSLPQWSPGPGEGLSADPAVLGSMTLTRRSVRRVRALLHPGVAPRRPSTLSIDSDSTPRTPQGPYHIVQGGD